MIESSIKIWRMVLTGHKVLDSAPWGGQYQIWSLKFMLVFFPKSHLSSHNNIFETETWYFWDNMKVLLGHLYTSRTSEDVEITQPLTKWWPAILLLIFAFLVSKVCKNLWQKFGASYLWGKMKPLTQHFAGGLT